MSVERAGKKEAVVDRNLAFGILTIALNGGESPGAIDLEIV